LAGKCLKFSAVTNHITSEGKYVPVPW